MSWLWSKSRVGAVIPWTLQGYRSPGGVKDKRRRDTDNFVGRTKPFIDGLVLAKVLVDDSRYNVSYEFQWHKAEQNETVITVKEQ